MSTEPPSVALPPPGQPFAAIQDEENASLQARRDWAGAFADARHPEAGTAAVAETGPPAGDLRTFNTVGLALSGGGIRSATFALGVLQALDTHRLIRQFDYLSTVSGGGYMGSALSSTLQSSNGTFVFGSPGILRDTVSVGHLRNYSNYLLPRDTSSLRNAADAVAVVGRGLVTNVLIVFAAILLLALLTMLAYPAAPTLQHGSFVPRLIDSLLPQHWSPPNDGPVNTWVSGVPFGLHERPFALTEIGLVVCIVAQVAWAIRRSMADWMGTDVAGPFLTLMHWLLGITTAVAFLDLHAVLVHLFIKPQDLFPGWLRTVWHYMLVPTGVLAAAATFLSGQLSTFLKSSQTSGRTRVQVARFGARAAMLFAAIVVPLMLELEYLAVTAALIEHSWRFSVAALVLFALVAGVAWHFEPNANSLHRFYRDRLSKAFHFEQVAAAFSDAKLRRFSMLDIVRHQGGEETASDMRAKRDVPTWTDPFGQMTGPHLPLVLAHRDPIDLATLDHPATPYHLINTTLNLQGSTQANMRGRNCDFFLFTPKHYGGTILNYHPVGESGVDLGTAVAISGAAVSSAMGSMSSFRVLAPTLALLNVRLGYWLRNPAKPLGQVGDWLTTPGRMLMNKFYLLSEMLGLLDEVNDQIYLTDGGHIENLGIYELLRRGCKLIVVVDAEADSELTCAALIKAERFARIDFGIRIDIDTPALAAANLAVNDAVDGDASLPSARGPHAALGRILYPNGTEGLLLYIKAALSGDEPDYILRYKRQYPAFPHEATGDQFFSEEQFECYRALGFHSMDGVLRRQDPVACHDDGQGSPAVLWSTMWAALMHAA